MSGTVRPVRTDGASLTAVRGLLERNLLERAVALAETRWPGSGPLVELAHEWATLSPVARRERLAAIGPDDLARLRGVAELQPDLARVLDDLESRGIIPPQDAEMVATADPSEPMPEPEPSNYAPMDEAAVVAALDDAGQGLGRTVTSTDGPISPQLDAATEAVAGATAAASAASVAAEAATFAAEAAAEAARLRAVVEPVAPVEMPDLDLGLPSTADFLAEEANKRLQAAEVASSILDRARSRVEDQAEKLLPTAEQPQQRARPDPDVIVPPPPIVEQAPPPPDAEPVMPEESTRVDSPIEVLQRRIEHDRVFVAEPDEPLPSSADLRDVADVMQLGYVELSLDDLGKQAFWGGLVREGRRVEPRAGAFPVAVSRPGLVVARGRFYPKAIERLREGYCDIPGTQATVHVHPDCRIVILPVW